MAKSSDPFDFGGSASGTTSGSTPSGIRREGEPDDDPFGYSDPIRGMSSSAYGGSDLSTTVSTTLSGAAEPPVWWLLAAAITAIGGGLLAATLGFGGLLAISAWVLAGPVSIGLLAIFTTQDTRQRAVSFSYPNWISRAYWTVLACALIGVTVSAWRLAGWVGRL